MKKITLFYSFFFFLATAFAQENCGNGIDDDGDGFIDCSDSDCMNGPVPPGSFFNTANNGSGGTIAGGGSDLNWQISVGSVTGPYLPAAVMSSIPGVYYASPWPDCGWISHSNDGFHSGEVDFYYKIEFLLPCYTPCGSISPGTSAYCLGMDFFADNSVDEIYVNGIPQSAFITGVPAADPYYNWGFGTSPITASLCKDWQPGLNVLIVKVSSGASYEGFLGQNSTSIPPFVIPDPTISSSTSTSLCEQDPPVTYTAATAGGTWSGTCGTCINSSTGVFNPATAGAGTHDIMYNITTPCPAADTITIQVLPTPNATITPEPPRCENSGSFNLTAATSGGTWTGTGITNSTSGTFDPATAGVGSHIISYSITTFCPATDTVTLIISQNAIAYAGAAQTICEGSSVTLAGSIGGSATSGIWSGGAGLYFPDNIFQAAVYTPSAAEATAGSVALIFTTDDPAGPCSSVNAAMDLTINQLPTANAGSGQYVCSGSSVTLAGSIGGSATNGTWSGGTGSYVPNSTTLNAVYMPSAAEYAADSVLLTLSTNDPAGPCTFSTSNVTIYFYKNPVIIFAADSISGCPVHCTDFTNSTFIGGGDIVGWDWDFGDGSPNSTIQTPSHCFTQVGFYDITLTAVSNNGCSSVLTQNQHVQVFNVPVAAFNASPNPATMLDPAITFTNQSSSDVNYWNWDFGDSTSISPNTANPVHTYSSDATGNYLATLIVRNNYGCYDTVAQEIIIGPGFTFYIPNAFTPDNTDGINDYFFGSGIGIEKYDLWIFDRWGDMIFHGKELNDKWDGKANNGENTAQIDVYIWKVEITDILDKKHSYIGTVTIVR